MFVAHCLLNENTRYLGGAFRPGAVDEVVDIYLRAGTGICHWIEAGDEGTTYLVYGTRARNDITYYPRKNGLWFKSAGVMIAADHISVLDD